MEYNFIEIGNRILNLRKSKGWSQERFIEELHGVAVTSSRNTISAIENGCEKKFSLDLLLACCKLFNCDMGYLLGEYGASKTRDGQFVHDVTGLSGPNVERLMSFNSSVQNGTVDAAQVYGIPSVDNDRTNYLIGDFGISAVNDMIEAYIAKPGIFCGYLEILNAYSRLSSEPDDDYLYNAALASTTEIAGYEHIPLREYIRFEVDRVTKAFGEYLISKYIGDDEIADRRRRE